MCRLNERQRTLAEKNINLVYFVLSKMKIHKNRYDYEDLLSAGYIGLCTAALNWKQGGLAFSTYAFYLVKKEILRVLAVNKRDSRNLTSLDGLRGLSAYFCGESEKATAEILFDEFFEYAEKNFGETELSVFKLLLTGKSREQIAKTLGLSESTVEKARAKVKSDLRDWLKDREC